MEEETLLIDRLEGLHGEAWGWALGCAGGERELAEEGLQRAYVKVAQGRVRFGGRSVLRTWWFGVVRLTVMEERRRSGRAGKFAERVREAWREWHGGRDVEEPVDGGGDEVVALRLALGRLAARQREVVHLVFYEGMSVDEAAVVMGVSAGSARTHYARAKQRLRGMLDEG